MEAVFGIVAAVIALVGLIAALGHVGFLAMLNNAGKKAGVSGSYASNVASSRWGVAGGTAAVALVGLLIAIASSSFTPDLLGLVLGGGAGLYSMKAIDTSRKQLRRGGGTFPGDGSAM